MRGEETQILGALAARATTASFVLPGTHSKWARIEAGRIVAFATYMTGEVFAVLKTHSVLGRMMATPPRGRRDARLPEGGRRLGCAEKSGRSAARGLHGANLSVCSARWTAPHLAEYLSGLLIGAEILSGAEGVDRATVIATAGLARRYVAAGARLGVRSRARARKLRDARTDRRGAQARPVGLIRSALCRVAGR